MALDNQYDEQFESPLATLPSRDLRATRGGNFFLGSGMPEPLYSPDESQTSGVAVGESDYDTPIDERSVTDASFINRQRAYKEPEYVKGFNAVVGGVVSGLATAVQDISYLADLDNNIGRLTGTQEVEDNWLSSAMKSFKQGLEETMPIYREDPNKVWDWGDSGSYWSGLKGVIDSAVGFGIPGMGAMKLATMATRGLRTTALLNGLINANRADKIASLGAGFLTNYAEGKTMAIEAFENSMNAMKQNYYDGILKKYTGQGMEIGEAAELANIEFEEGLKAGKEAEFRQIAGTHADRFQRNNMAFMVTDAMGLSGLFKATKGLTRNIVTKESMKNYFLGANVDNFLVQGAKESAEEIGQNVMQSESEYQSAVDAKIKTLEPENTLDRLIGFATSDKAILEGAMGFFGGPIQRVLTQGLAGQYGDKYNKDIQQQIADQESQIKTNQEFFATKLGQHKTAADIIALAEEAGHEEAAKAMKENAFSTVVADNFAKGTTTALEESLKEIAAMTPEQAKEKGYTEDYAKKAQDMLEQIPQLEKEWIKASAYSRPSELFQNRQTRKLANITHQIASKELSKATNNFINAFKSYENIDFSQEAFEKQQFVEDPQLNSIIRNSPEFNQYQALSNNLKEASELVQALDKNYATLTSVETQQTDLEAAKKVSEMQKELAKKQAEAAKQKKAEASRKAAADRANAKKKATVPPKQATSTEAEETITPKEKVAESAPPIDETAPTMDMFEESDKPEAKTTTGVNTYVRQKLNKLNYPNSVIEAMSPNDISNTVSKEIPYEDYVKEIELRDTNNFEKWDNFKVDKGTELFERTDSEEESNTGRKVTSLGKITAFKVAEDGTTLLAVKVGNRWLNNGEWANTFTKKSQSKVAQQESTAADIENTIEVNNSEESFTDDKVDEVDREHGTIDTQVAEENKQTTVNSEGEVTYEYKRIVDGYNAFAYLSRAFKQLYDITKRAFVRQDVDNMLVEAMLEKQLLSSNKYIAGTPVTIELADDDTLMYDPSKDDKSKITWGDYVKSKNLKTTDAEWINAVPIVIKNSEGKIIAHLHIDSWITEQNVAGNIEENKELLKTIREAVIKEKKIETTIASKTIGTLFRTHNNQQLSVADAMPDPNLTIAVGKDNKFYTNRGEQFTLANVVNKKATSGVVYAIVPFGDKSIALPLYSVPMSSREDIIESILAAVKIYATKDVNNPLVRQLFNILKIDITTPQGISAYVNMFVANSKISNDILAGKSNQGVVAVEKGSINFGFGGDKANFINQNTNPANLDNYLKGLANVLRAAYTNVSLSNINNDSKVAFIKNGVVTSDSYLNYVKSVTKTNVVSANIGTAENPEYTYFIQPVIKLNTDAIISNAKQAKTETASATGIDTKRADIERRRQEELLGKTFVTTTEKVVVGKGQSAGKTVVRYTESKVSSDGEVLTIKPKAKFKGDDTSSLSTTPETMTVKEFKEQFYENLSQEDKEMFDEFFTDDTTRIRLVEARIGLKGLRKGQVNIDIASLEGQPFGFELQNAKKINAKYDAELAALEQSKGQKAEMPTVEEKKADIERRREKELGKINQRIEKLKQKEDRRVKIETYRTLSINDDPIEVEIHTNADGTRLLKAREINEDGSVEPMAYAIEKINNKAQATLTNEKLIEGYIGNEGNTLKRTNVDENPNQTYIDKINANYNAKLDALESKPEVTTPITEPEVVIPPKPKPAYKSKKINRDTEDGLLASVNDIRKPLLDSAANVYAEELGAVKQNQIVSYLRGRLISEMFTKEEVNLTKVMTSLYDEYQQLLTDALDDVKAAEEANEEADVADFRELADEIQKVLNNWAVVSRLAKEAVAKINGVSINLDEDEFEDNDSSNQERFDADRAFTMDGFNKLSIQIKRLFGNIADVDKQGNTKENYLNQTVYVPFDVVYKTLQGLTANTEGNFDVLLTKLAANNEAIRWMPQVIDMLKQAPSEIKNAFVSNMTNHTHNMVFIMWDRDKNGKYVLTEYNANSNAVQQVLRMNWENLIKYTDVVRRLADGSLVGDKEAIEAHIEALNGVKEAKTVIAVKSWLNTIGIELSDGAINELLTGKVKGNTFEGQFSNSSGIFNILKTNLNNLINKDIADSTFFSDSAVKALARLEEKYKNDISSDSFRAGNKTVYSYGSNKHLVNQMRRLKEVNRSTRDGVEVSTNELATELWSTNFTKNSDWLKGMLLLDNNGQAIYADNGQVIVNTEGAVFKNLGHAVVSLEAIKQTGQASKDNRELYKLSPVEIEVFKIGMLQAVRADQSQNNKRVIALTYPTTSDKTSVYLIQTIAMDLGFTDEGELDEATYDRLYDSLVLPELARISAFQKMTSKPNNKEYNKGANYFIMLPECNNIVGLFDEDGNITADAYNEEFKNKFKEVIKTYVTQLVNDKLNQWKDYGIGETSGNKKEGNYKEDSFLDSKFLSSLKVLAADKVKAAATDMVVQYLVGNAESFKMFIGDPAQFWKPDRNSQTISERVEDTFNNIGKRLAADIAPGIELANAKDNEYIQIFVEDNKAASVELNGRLKKLLDKQDWVKYGGIKRFDSTDAQEYTTLKEHLYVLQHLGRLSDEQYNKYMEIYNRQLKSLADNGIINDADKFTKEDLGEILQPLKPVYVGNKLESEKDFIRRTYIKSSSFPLIPELTFGLQLDKVRVAMEKLESANESKTVRLAYLTAVKVGAPATVAEIWDKDGNVVDNIDFAEGTWTYLNRSGFRIQQDVPYDPHKDSIKEVTQASKNLFVNMESVEGFMYEGKAHTGKELHAKYDELHGKLYEIGVAEVKEMITNDDGTVNMEALREFVKDEAIRRGYNISEKLLIDLDKDLNFLPYSAVADKYQAVLNALVYDRILKQKIKGKSFVLGSAQGFKGDKAAKDAYINSTSGIIFTDSWDATKGIMPTGENSDGSVKLAQVLIPWKFKDANGNKISITQFINKDTKKIDFNKLPKELLEVFGMRIPNQGPNSQIALEIVGFLPESSGDLIIAPEDLVVQMGSDFDVDKLYTYMYNYFYYKGKLSKNIPEGAELEKAKASLQSGIESLKQQLASLKEESKGMYAEIVTIIEYINDVAYTKKGKERSKLIDDSEEAISEILATIRMSKDVKESVLNELADLYYLASVLKKAPKMALQNRILDIHMAVHKNPNKDVQAAIAKPIDVWELGSISKDIMAAKRKRADAKLFTGISEAYQTKKFIQAVQGKSGTGNFSLDSMFNAICQNKGLKFKGTKEDPFEIRFGNLVSTGDLSREKTLNNKEYISDIIAAYQSAAVDNEKLQVLDKLNINGETFSAIKALNQLGFGEAGVWFIAQDIIFDYVEELRKIKGAMGEYVLGAEKIAIDKLINGKYNSAKYKSYKSKYATAADSDRFKELRDSSVSKLRDMVLYTDTKPEDYIDTQLALLDKFLYLTSLGEEISELQRGVNIDSKGFGKSVIESNLREEQIIKIFDSPIVNSTKLFGDVITIEAADIQEYVEKGYTLRKVGVTNYMIKPTTIPGMAVVHGLFTNNDLWNQIFPTNTYGVQTVFSEIERMFGLEDRSFNTKSENRFKIWNAVKAYMFSTPHSIYDDEVNGRRAFLLKDVVVDNEFIHKSLATIVTELKKSPKLVNNAFIQRLQLRQEKGTNKPMLIEYNASAKEGVDETKIYVDFLDLLVRSRELGTFNNIPYDTTRLAQELIEYSYITGGIQEAIQFLKVIPPAYLKATGFIDHISSINLNDPNTLGIVPDMETTPYFDKVSTFTQQYIQHNPGAIKQKLTDVSAQTTDAKYTNGILTSFKLAYNEETFPLLIKVKGIDTPVPPVYITMYEAKANPKQAIFKFNGESFERIANLGGFGVREFKMGAINQASAINSNFTVTMPVDNKPIPAKKVIPNNTKLTVVEQYDFKESANGKEQLAQVLARISRNGGLTGTLADLYTSELDSLDDFSMAFTDEAGFFGKWVGTTRVLKLNEAIANQLSPVEFERKFLHEVTHLFTVHLISPYLDANGNLDISKVTDPKLRKSLVALNSALNQYRKYLAETDAEGLAAFKAKYKATIGDKSAVKGRNFTDEEIAKYYSELNLKEFIAQALTDERFQTILNVIPDANETSLFGKIKKAVADILSKIFGIDNKSLLYSTIKNTIDLISSQEDTIEVVPDSSKVNNFQGYKGGFEDKGKGTPQGDGKDKAMREVANSAIVELASDKPSSSKTTLDNLGNYSIGDKVVMLARNGKLSNNPLTKDTKALILLASREGAEFIVGDMPNVDSQFIDYLQEIGAKFTIYHTGNKPRIIVDNIVAPESTTEVSEQTNEDPLTKLSNNTTFDDLFEILTVDKESTTFKDNKNHTFTFTDGTTISTGFKLNTQQEEALQKMADFYNASDKTTFTLSGYAGTGKTTIVKFLVDYINTKTFFSNIVFSSPTHRANAVLKQSLKGLKVRTLHSTLGLSADMQLEEFDANNIKFEVQREPVLSYGALLVIDESSMINDDLYNFIFKIVAENNIKVLFMGDKAQLKPAKQETLSKVFTKATDNYELTKVERTGDNPLLKESMIVRNSTDDVGFSLKDASNSSGEGVTFTRDTSEFLTTFVNLLKSEEFKNNKLLARVLSFTNAHVENHNTAIRKALWGAGNTKEYIAGDLIMGNDNFNVNYKTKEPVIINSGDYVVVEASNEKSGYWGDVQVKYYDLVLKDVLDDTKQEVRIKMLSKNNTDTVYTQIAQEYERKRKEALTLRGPQQAQAWAALSSFKWSYATNKDMVFSGKTKIKTTIKYGYAHTIHKSQGGTYKYSFVDSTDIYKSPDKQLRKQLKYVGITRAQKHAYVLYNKPIDNDEYDYNSLDITYDPDDMRPLDEMFDALPYGYDADISIEELKRICK